ncbi:probable inactive tRNA-specific adenosine deaminase-like protein 3 isoform X2 [Macrobrachium rosenbergii]|uniref:probable inactive tRNA-specific adenosine deaminase-like protein 3 isoform X2 n=1 Tax=Macrobrachium rosenbergii TaxID=79674 RepID=UPI0034D615E2
MAGSKDYAVLDLQDKSDSLSVDLQFQDFGETRTQSSGGGGQHEQTITFSDFPDTPDEELEQEKVGPKSKRIKFDAAEISSLPLAAGRVQVTAVLPEGVFGDPEFVQVAVLEVKDKKSTSVAIKELSLKFPVPSLCHLKRVRKLMKREDNCPKDSVSVGVSLKEALLVYLTYLKDFDIPNLMETGDDNLAALSDAESRKVIFKLNEKGISLAMFTGKVFVSKVAKYSPKVRDMYDKVSPFWPCSLHEDQYLVWLSSANLFKEEELTVIIKFMNEALELGNLAGKESGENVGVVIVDSTNGSVVGHGQDRRHKHPAQHAAMIAVDHVAANQNGGAWDIHAICKSKNMSSSLENGKGEVDFTTAHERIKDLASDASFELMKSTPSTRNSESKLLGENDENSEAVSYICTGLDVYMTREPCMMCAMALLHSRVRRIFYRFPNPEAGALESKTKLHILGGLNHRYEVFSVKPA